MNFKKIGLFFLFFIIGIFLFGILTLLALIPYISWLLPLFFLLYVYFLFLTVNDFSKKRVIILISIFLMYFILMLIPFPKCDSWGKWGSSSQECTCIGIKKYSIGIFDASWSQCIGFPADYKTKTKNIIRADDLNLGVQDCQSKSQFAQTFDSITAKRVSSYCRKSIYVDNDNDGYAETIVRCYSSKINVKCANVTEFCTSLSEEPVK